MQENCVTSGLLSLVGQTTLGNGSLVEETLLRASEFGLGVNRF